MSDLNADVKIENAAALSMPTRGLISQLGTIFSSRLIINTSRRMTYTFAVAFARGLGVPLTSITSLIALNQAASMLGPIFGFWGDRWGYKLLMMSGVGCLSFGLLAGGLLPGYATLVLALVLAGISKAMFDPTALAYVGEQVPYHRRGLAMGLIELPWAGSTLIGIPLMGLMIDRFGWRSPLLAMGILAAGTVLAVGLFIPGDGRRRVQAAVRPDFGRVWRQAKRNPAVLAALGFTLFVACANDTLFVVYGVWLETSFSLTVVALGISTMVIGVAELLGEGLTAAVSDRLGLGRALVAGMSLTVVSYLILLPARQSFTLALVALFLVFLGFEFTMVTSFAYLSELLPDARGTMMSSALATASVGRIVGALGGAYIWLVGGISATSVVAALISALALVCVVVMVRHRR